MLRFQLPPQNIATIHMLVVSLQAHSSTPSLQGGDVGGGDQPPPAVRNSGDLVPPVDLGLDNHAVTRSHRQLVVCLGHKRVCDLPLEGQEGDLAALAQDGGPRAHAPHGLLAGPPDVSPLRAELAGEAASVALRELPAELAGVTPRARGAERARL